MNTHELLMGLFLGAYGVAFLGFFRWYARDDGRLRRMAESRWWLDRRAVRSVRSGQMTKDEWFARWTLREQALVKWAVTPFFVLWSALCVAMIVHSFIH